MRVRSTSPRNRRLACTVVALLLLAGCDQNETPAVPEPTPAAVERGGTITFGVLGAPPTLDPYSGLASDLTYFLARPVYRSLYRVTPNGAIEPDLVASETPVRGGFEITLERAWWSDGTLITASDVVASVHRAVPPSGFAGLTATAIDRSTVRLRADVFGDWVRHLAIGSFVLPDGKAGELASGPFQVARYVPGLEIVYEPNSSAVSDRPLLDRLKVQFISSVATMIELLDRGELDAAAIPSTINTGARLDELQIAHSHTKGWETISLDLSEVSDVSLRADIAAAIDTSPIAEGLIREEGAALSPRVPDAGRIDAAEIQLATASGDELLQLMQRIIQRQLAAEDIEVELAAIDPAVFYGEWQEDAPVDVLLERTIVPFGGDRVSQGLTWLPLFSVDTIVASNRGIHGPEAANGGIDGPLWNAEAWWRE